MYNNNINNEEINNNNIDESQFVIERVEFALTSFYRPINNDFSSLPQLQDWLMQFQRSFSAWSISPILLMSKTTEIQYFGASTIESKIKNSWLSLNSEMRVEFLDRLLLFLKNHIGNCLNIVVTRLCLAVSVIACHSTPDLWANPIMDIIQLSFQDVDNLNSFNPTMVNLTLELLTIFPEELTNSDYITQEKRNKVAQQYNKHNSKVFEIISKIMTLPQNQQTTSYMKSSLKCLKSWIIFDCSPKEYLVESEIILKCFEAVSKNPLLVEDFLMVLDELFTFMGGKVFRSFPSSFNTILSRILVIFPSFYLMAIQEDNQIFNQIFLLFSHVAEYHIKLLLKSPELSKDFFKAFIQMAVKGDFETCELLAPVVTEIASLHETSNDDNSSNGVDLSGWTQHLCEMVEVFRLKSMYPIDQEISSMSLEDTEKFTKFRSVAGDSTLEIYGILETQILQQLLNTLWTDMQSFPTTQNWQSIESTVFLLGCLSEGITESTEFIPQLFTILGHLPIQSTPLIKSTMMLAGKYSNLIDKSTQFLEKIVTDFFPAFQNPELKVVASQAFLSISKNLKCSQLLSTGIDQLISLCLPVLLKNNQIINDPSNFSIIEALLYIISVLPNNDILNYSTKLLSPFIFYIKDYKQSTITASTTTSTTTTTTTQQSKQHQQQQQQPISNELSLLLSSINLLTNFCKIYDDNHEVSNNNSSTSPPINENDQQQQQQESINNKPVYQIINHIIPIYGDLLVQNNLESSIIEAISSFYKKAIIISSPSNINNQSSTSTNTITTTTTINIPEINRQLTIAFLKHKSLAMVLNSLSICIVNLPKEQPMDFLVESLSSISTKIIEIWKSNANVAVGGHSQLKKEIDNNNSMDNNNNSNSSLNEFLNFNISIYPDICKEYFSLITQYIKYNVVSIPKGVISHLFSTILANITSIHDKVTARACFSFMSLVISKSKEMKDQIKWEPLLLEINNWLSIHGEFLVRQVLYCAGGGIPRGVIQFISEVIASLVSSYPEVFRLSALKNLSIDGFPSQHISKAYKEKFVNTLMLYRSKKLPLKVIQDFSLVSLGISTESQNK